MQRLAQVSLQLLLPALPFLQACLASSKQVRMPNGERVIRIACHYEQANCHRYAEDECNGAYEVVTKGDRSCADCGVELNSPDRPPAEGNNVFRGVLYVRCRH